MNQEAEQNKDEENANIDATQNHNGINNCPEITIRVVNVNLVFQLRNCLKCTEPGCPAEFATEVIFDVKIISKTPCRSWI